LSLYKIIFFRIRKGAAPYFWDSPNYFSGGKFKEMSGSFMAPAD